MGEVTVIQTLIKLFARLKICGCSKGEEEEDQDGVDGGENRIQNFTACCGGTTIVYSCEGGGRDLYTANGGDQDAESGGHGKPTGAETTQL